MPLEDEILLSPNMKLLVISGVYDYKGQCVVDLMQPKEKTFVF